ncbi:MAG: hypothetical protein A3D92_22610 [Bacteroidetes bacterium RIFCSPHIGHO2_02_FULL_44_7]|nr:MAG: hypothetical protein A3D92_22610 [Bacteroidetes bacterium RIFCSPHIGHO2_02_FULL_44_7]
METPKNVGIWMDHASAKFFEVDARKSKHSVASKFDFSVKEEALGRSENLMHNKEQQMHEAYYKDIAEGILKYDHVLLFGPTQAKTELYNYLSKDTHFKNIRFDIEPADKMTENEKHAFVKDHFDAK